MAYPMKPILHITVKDSRDILFEEMDRWASEMGYALLMTVGKQGSASILSHKRMKRADYAACINAAKAMLKPTR